MPDERPLGTVLVTGGASGLGAAVAAAVEEAGRHRGRARPRRAAERLRVRAGRPRATRARPRRPSPARPSAPAGSTRVVTAAGTDACGDIGDVDPEAWDRVVLVNLLGTAAVVRAALPHLERSRGRVVTVASTLGLRALPAATAYCASKFGVVGFTRALAIEMGDRVGVTMLVPGGMQTHFFDDRPDEVQARAGPAPQRPGATSPAASLFALRQPPGRRAARAGRDARGRAVLAVSPGATARSASATSSPASRRCARWRARSPTTAACSRRPRALAPLAALTGAVDEVADTAPLGRCRRCAAPTSRSTSTAAGPQSHAVLRAPRPRRLIAFGDAGGAASWRAGRARGRALVPAARGVRHPRRPARPALARRRRAGARRAPGATRDPPRRGERGAPLAGRALGRRRARTSAPAGRRVVVTGGRGERDARRESRAPPAAGERVLAGAHRPRSTLAAVVAAAGRVVCGDTGVAHLATAFGTPSVVLFGPTPPGEWGPPPTGPAPRAVGRAARRPARRRARPGAARDLRRRGAAGVGGAASGYESAV